MAKEKYKEPNPICQKLQYLIGVPSQYIKDFEALNNKGVMIETRKLCCLRNAIISNFVDVKEQFKQGVQLADIQITSRLVSDLRKYGIEIKNQLSLSRNVMEINDLIDTRIEKLVGGFKGIPQEWIQELFQVPNKNDIDGVRVAVRRYNQFKTFYPYQRYINWDFSVIPEEKRSKNILGNDKEFIELITEVHASKSAVLFDFIGTSKGNTVVVVDCENSDAQQLYSVLQPAHAKISKIILVDSSHTNSMWAELADDFTKEGIVVEHDELPRLKEQKSLVDLRMVAKTCEAFYKDKVANLILATSDSDVWALIESLPSANILVLAEKNKVGDVLIEALTQKGIKYAFMEDIADGNTELIDRVMHKQLNTMMSKNYIDVRRMVINAAQKLNLFLEKDEVDKYVGEVLSDINLEKDYESGKVVISYE